MNVGNGCYIVPMGMRRRRCRCCRRNGLVAMAVGAIANKIQSKHEAHKLAKVQKQAEASRHEAYTSDESDHEYDPSYCERPAEQTPSYAPPAYLESAPRPTHEKR